jgi:hypothetical protein
MYRLDWSTRARPSSLFHAARRARASSAVPPGASWRSVVLQPEGPPNPGAAGRAGLGGGGGAFKAALQVDGAGQAAVGVADERGLHGERACCVRQRRLDLHGGVARRANAGRGAGGGGCDADARAAVELDLPSGVNQV